MDTQPLRVLVSSSLGALLPAGRSTVVGGRSLSSVGMQSDGEGERLLPEQSSDAGQGGSRLTSISASGFEHMCSLLTVLHRI